MLQNQEWESFTGRLWKEECNVRDFIQNNYTPYDGDESFLAGPTDATNKLWDKLQALQKAERDNGGVLKETQMLYPALQHMVLVTLIQRQRILSRS